MKSFGCGYYYCIIALALKSSIQQCCQSFPMYVYLSFPKKTETLGTSGSRAEVLCMLGRVPDQLEFLSALSLFPVQNAMFPRT